MDALWARRAAVACLHPGWSALSEPRRGHGELGSNLVQPRLPAHRLL
jgi:hypothetical protein